MAINRYPLQGTMDDYSDSEPTAMRRLKPAMAATTTAWSWSFVLQGDVEASKRGSRQRLLLYWCGYTD